MPKNLTLALGTLPATPLQIATGYAVFANGGYKVMPYFIDRIENAAGQVVWQRQARVSPCDELRACGGSGPDLMPTLATAVRRHLQARRLACAVAVARCRRDQHVAARVISPAERLADGRHDGRRDQARHRASAPASLGRSDIAGKTGTTNEAKDTWFNGFTPNLVATVWVGFDQERPLGEGEEGARTAVPIWIHFMREALRGVPDVRRPMPAGLVTLRVSSQTGALASAENPDGLRRRSWPTTCRPLPTAMPARWRKAPKAAPSTEPHFLDREIQHACRMHPSDNLRRALAQEAARIMAEHGIQDFRTAKRKAAERLGVTDAGAVLPRNTEIEAALAEYQRLFGGESHVDTLHAQRRAALHAMRYLREFEPRLVGPVLSGTATAHTDVQLHLFADRAETVTLKLMDRGIAHEVTEQRVRWMPSASWRIPGVRFELDRSARSRRRCFRSTASARRRSARSMAGRCGARTRSKSRRCSRTSSSAERRLRRRDLGSLALGDVDVVALRRTGVQLPRPADAHVRIGDHLLPVRHPADGAGDREHHREHRARNAERAVDDARVEIDVRVELARDEVLVLERDLLEPQRQLEQRIVRAAELRRAPCGTSRG